MIVQEQFERIESEHGCGYWNICAEHSCPCAIITENKGLQESIYNEFIKENKKLAEEYDNDDFEYEPLARCIICGRLDNENDLIYGVCFDCFEETTEETRDIWDDPSYY